jgi:hypothetical protein
MSEDEALELLLQYDRLRTALQAIADHSGADSRYGHRDEWTEAAGFTECQRIAREALAQTEATE